MNLPKGAIVLPRDGGRHYDMGPLRAVFKADEEETGQRYSVSGVVAAPQHRRPRRAQA